MKRAIATALLALAPFVAWPQAEEVAKPDPAVEQRLKDLADELRCLVCQNQTIADSNAPLALDLRNQIRTQIGQGRTDDQIRTYMVERYGDFVLYNPPFKATTIVLWLGPLLLLAAGAAAFWTVASRRVPTNAASQAEPARRAEVEALLASEAAKTAAAPAKEKKRRRR
jgi:cytochrome c-type biogenesis protein CcmH